MADPTTGAPDQEQPPAAPVQNAAATPDSVTEQIEGGASDPQTDSMMAGDPSALFTGAKEIGRGVVHGALTAVHETSQAIDGAATAGTKAIKRAGIPDVVIGGHDKEGNFHLVQLDRDPNTDASEGQAVVPQIDAFKPTTSLGHVTASGSQFLTGMALFGRVGGLVRGAAGKAAGETVKAGLSNAFSFDSHDGMLADTLRDYPSIAQYASPFISSKDDPEALARFKRGIEGLGLGALGEAFFSGVSAYKAFKAGDSEAAVAASNDTKAALGKVQQEGMKPTAETLAADPNVQAVAQSNLRIKMGQIDDSVSMPRTNGETIPLVDGPRFDKPVADDQLAAAGDKPQPSAVRQPELPTQPVPEAPVLSDEALSDYRGKLARNEDWLANGGVLGDSVDTNFGRFPTSNDVRSTITALEEQVKASPGALDGVQSLGDVRKMASKLSDVIGSNPDDVLAYMGQDAKDIRTLGSRITAYGDFYVSQATKVSKLAQAVNERLPGQFGDMDTLLGAFEKHARILNETRTLYRSLSADTSRALGSYRVGLKSAPENMAGADLDSFAGSEDDLIKMARAITMSDGSAGGLTNAMTASMPNQVVQKANSLLVNSLLSLRTGVVKGSSDLFKLAITPVEKVISGAYQAIGGGASGLVQDGMAGAINGVGPGIARAREGLGLYASYGRFLFDALDSAGRAFKLGGQITDAAHGHMIPEGFGDGSVFSNLMDGNQGYALVNALTKYTTLPTRVIGTIDEFTKNLTYRAEVYRKAVKDVSLDSTIADKSAAIDARMNASFGPQGQALDKDALNIARESTFSQDPIRDPNKLWFGSKSLTAATMDLVHSVPVLRQVQPFIKVPSNIARYQWQRTPGLNLLQKEYVSDLTAGGERTADALAKATTGGAIMAAGVYLANAGMLTGTLHPDPAVQRQIEDQTGQRHNSWVINHPDGTKDYVPLAQFADPLGPMLSASADYARVSHYLPDGDLMSFGSAMAATIGHGLADKRYLEGITNAMSALTGALDPSLTKGERVKKFTAQLMSGYVPSMLANHSDDDPYQREIRGYLDGVLRKTPGSVGVDPHRNLLGEPVQTATAIGPSDLSPFQRAHDDQDPVNAELARQLTMGDKPVPRLPYKLGLPGQPQAVDLTKIAGPNGFSAYDRLQELMSNPPGKPSLREALTAKMNSPEYANALTDGVGQYEGSRRFEIDKIIGAYQKAGKDSLLAESKNSPDSPLGNILKQAEDEARNRAAALKGTPLPAPSLVKPNAFKQAIAQP